MFKVSNFTFLIQKCAFSTHACDKDIILNAFDIVSIAYHRYFHVYESEKNHFLILYRTYKTWYKCTNVLKKNYI